MARAGTVGRELRKQSGRFFDAFPRNRPGKQETISPVGQAVAKGFLMERAFWQQRWEQRQIGFHEGRPNALLERHILRVAECKRVYVPLCGKAVDLAYLAGRGHEVLGSEVVREAVLELFKDLGLRAEETALGPFRRHAAVEAPTDRPARGSIVVLEGDAFQLGLEHTGGAVDAIYDRAALVALDPKTRRAYADALTRVLRPSGFLFLIAFDYPQDMVDGPPWALPTTDVHALFADRFTIELLEETPTTGGPKFAAAGVPALTERAFLLQKKA